MESSRLRLLPLLGAALLLLLPLLGALAQEDAELRPRALDVYSAVEDASHEKELVSIPPSPAPDTLGLPRGPFLCRHSSSSGPQPHSRGPGILWHPEIVWSPRDPGSLSSKSLVSVPRSNASLGSSGT
jgi:hypothetical protein